MNSNSILTLFREISKLKSVDLSEFVEQRLDLLLNRYEETLQESYDNVQRYDTLEVIRGLNSNAKSK